MTSFVEQFHAQRDRWILWVPLPVACGIGAYFSLNFEPARWIGAAMMGMLLLPLVLFFRNKIFLFGWLVIFLAALGFTAAQVRTWTVEAPVLHKETYPLYVQGRVLEVDALPTSYRVVLDQLTAEGKWGVPDIMPERVRIRLIGRDAAVPEAGDIIKVKAVLIPLSPPVAPGAFDFQRHAFFHRLGATGYAVEKASIVDPKESGFFLEELRHYIRGKVEADLGKTDAAAVVIALLIGEGKGITEKMWDTIRLSGIAHLLAISGFHITLVAGFVFFLTRAGLAAIPRMALHYPIKKMSAFVAMLGAIFYMLLVGSPIPAERSVIMVCVVMTAIMLDRDPFTLRLAAFSALAILLVQPESLMGPSFQLSFAAVIALISFYEGIRNWWSESHEDRTWVRKANLYILSCFLTTLIATSATAMFSLYHFARVPLLSGLVANMIAVPVSAFITMPFGILSCFLMPLGLEQWPLWVTEKSVVVILNVAGWVAKWPYAVYQADAWPMYLLVMMTLGGLWICIWTNKIRWAGVLPILLGIALIPLSPRPDILVSDKANLFAVRDDAGKLWISSGRMEKFVREEWTEREGGKGVGFWPKRGMAAGEDFLRCDEYACLYRAKGQTVSFIREPEALEEDCKVADIVLSGRKIRRDACAKKTDKGVIVKGKWDIRDAGAHAIFIDAESGAVRIKTVAEDRGVRPWTGKVKKEYKVKNDENISRRSAPSD